MAEKKRRRSRKKSSRRSLTKKMFGGSRDSFDGKNKSSNVINKVAAASFAVLLICGLVYFFVFRGIDYSSKNLAASVAESEPTDLVENFDEILNKGTLSQKQRLLRQLTYANLDADLVPVRLDHYRKIVEVSDRILEDKNVAEELRVEATLSKLESLWRSYALNFNNEMNDPFIVEQFFATIQESLSDPNDEISRESHIYNSKGLVAETIGKRSRGSYEKIEFSLSELLTRFPDDPGVHENVRTQFTRVRATSAEDSVRIAERLAEATKSSENPETRKLSRFMKDIIALYDAGIGNSKTISDIIVDDQEFMSRLSKLNEHVDTGPTVVTQLDNAIEFFERQRKYQNALELSKQVLAIASRRTDSEAAAMAEEIGRNGVKRNSLIDHIWEFNGVDENGNAIAPEKFKNRVTMIVFYSIKEPSYTAVSTTLGKMERAMNRKALEIVRVKVGDGTPENAKSGHARGRIRIRSTLSDPHEYYLRCPSNRLPYAILIDKNGKVDTINVSLNSVKTRIELLLSAN